MTRDCSRYSRRDYDFEVPPSKAAAPTFEGPSGLDRTATPSAGVARRVTGSAVPDAQQETEEPVAGSASLTFVSSYMRQVLQNGWAIAAVMFLCSVGSRFSLPA